MLSEITGNSRGARILAALPDEPVFPHVWRVKALDDRHAIRSQTLLGVAPPVYDKRDMGCRGERRG